MYRRILPPPKSTFFLLGPRGTGKSTWVAGAFTGAHRIDLLRASTFLTYQLRPEAFREEVLPLPARTWVLVDEIQKLPLLLDEIHALIFDTQGRYNFALTGSSTRKLKR